MEGDDTDRSLAASLLSLGEALRVAGSSSDASAAYSEAVSLLGSEETTNESLLAEAYFGWADAMHSQRRFDEADSLLQQAIEELVGADQVSGELTLAPDQGALRAALYRDGLIESESFADDGQWRLEVRLPRKRYEQLMKQFAALEPLGRESSA